MLAPFSDRLNRDDVLEASAEVRNPFTEHPISLDGTLIQLTVDRKRCRSLRFI